MGLSAVSAYALAAPLQSKPGEYEVTVTAEAMGMSLPVQTHRQCVTQKDMDDGRALAIADLHKRCPELVVSRQGSRVSLSAHCASPAMSVRGEGTSEPEAFSMKFLIHMSEPIKQTQRQTVTARRLGDCR